MKSTLLLLALASLGAAPVHAAPPSPQLYFAPSSLSSSSSPSSPAPALTPQQANAAIAHLLSVSHFTALPPNSGKKGGREWERVLEEEVDASQPRVVLAIECGKYGCDDALPPSLSQTPSHYTLPSLPLPSYLSALSLHLHRFASSLGLDGFEENKAVVGSREFVEEGIKGVVGWQGWVSEELGGWIGWGEIKKKVKPAVEPELPKTGLFSDMDMLDSSAAPLLLELEKLTQLADSFSPSSRSYEADGSVVDVDSSAQTGGQPQIVVVHLKGLKALSEKHSPSSPVYTTALSLLRSTLSGFYSSISSQTQTQSGAKFVVLTLPPHPTPLLRRKEGWLKPFEVRGAKYGAGGALARGLNGHVKRSVFSPSANPSAGGRVKRQSDGGEDDEDWTKSAPIVPSSRTCFSSASDARNQTASCLGRGEVVRGLSTRLQGEGECWVCRCHPTTEEVDGKVVKKKWAGEGCEKEDLSSSFTLLLSSSLLLLFVLLLSVGLLYKVGAEDLPGTLGGVGGGGGGHAKRD